MATTEPHDDYEFHIDPTGQKPGLWDLYTQLTFCYPLSPDAHTSQSIQSHITHSLDAGLKKLADRFPWTAGQVIKQSRQHDNDSDYFVIKSYKPTPALTVKDLSTHLPTFDTYAQKDFPINLLDEADLASRNTLPSAASSDDDPKPVFLVQVTFVTGGTFLTFAAQHGTLDLVGLGEVCRLIDKACNGFEYTDEEVEMGNRDRRTLVPSHEEEEEEEEEEEQQQQQEQKQKRQQDHGRQTNTKAGWCNFLFSSSSLQSLKQSAMDTLPDTHEGENKIEYISTDDALTAFIWQSISRARSPRLDTSSPSTITTLARTVDLRRALSIPATYPGNLATRVHLTIPFSQLASSTLGTIAAQLRSELRFAALVEGPRRSRDLSRDVALSSWVKLDWCYGFDFGLGCGDPVAVVRPAFTPMEGVVYLLPKSPDGGIVVSICLDNEELMRLGTDEEWMKYAVKIG